MDQMHLVVRSIILGFIIALPTGPVGLLCLWRIVAKGSLTGFISGLASSLGDALYVAVVIFGIARVGMFLDLHHTAIRLVGLGLIFYLGIKTFFASPKTVSEKEQRRGLSASFGSALLLTLTNPVLIISFTALFTATGVAGAIDGNYTLASLVILSVFLGSLLWWSFATLVLRALRQHLATNTLRYVNRFSGLAMILFGLAAVWLFP
jgi:threonine/homoserine/homoserine lactone efflux protein